MSITTTRGTSSLSQVQSPRSEPSSSPQAAFSRRPQGSVAQELARDSFTECPYKAKVRQLSLGA